MPKERKSHGRPAARAARREVPPRLHVLLARDASTAVVIRRGPARHTAVIGWERNSDTFRLGQWLYGRIYERRSDLSPDGKHLIYFAMNGRWHSTAKGTSSCPTVTAIRASSRFHRTAIG